MPPKWKCLFYRTFKETFTELCDWMVTGGGGLKPGEKVTIEQQIAIFLSVVGHSCSNREVQERFQISGYTVTKYVVLFFFY